MTAFFSMFDPELQQHPLKRVGGRLIVRAIKIDATSKQVAQVIFKAGRKPDKPKA